MGEHTRQYFRRWHHRKTTIAGFLFAIAVGLRHIPGANHYADALEAIAVVLLGSWAADGAPRRFK